MSPHIPFCYAAVLNMDTASSHESSQLDYLQLHVSRLSNSLHAILASASTLEHAASNAPP